MKMFFVLRIGSGSYGKQQGQEKKVEASHAYILYHQPIEQMTLQQ